MASRRETPEQLKTFEAWYESGRSFRKISEKLGVRESTLYGWAERFNWHERADARDAEVARQNEKDAIARRVKMLENQRKDGEFMRNIGMTALAEHAKAQKPIDPKTGALLVKEGYAHQRQGEGMPAFVVELLNATDHELRQRIADLQGEIAGISDSDGRGEAPGD